MKYTQVTALFLLVSVLTLSGCNMFRGAGEDIEEAGDEIKDATR